MSKWLIWGLSPALLAYAGMSGGYDTLEEMVNFYNRAKRSGGSQPPPELACGAKSAPYNEDLFLNLPMRTVLSAEPRNTSMSSAEEDEYRIVNGQTAMIGSWPWQIRARPCSKWRCTYLCGGSLLSNQWSITAAHCIPYAADRGTITVGAHQLWGDNSIPEAGTNVTITRIVNHPGWNRYKRNNDIALLNTKRVIYTDYVRPICLPDPNTCFNEGTACVVSGWGYTTEKGPVSDTLQEVSVRIIDYGTCSSTTMYNTMVYPDSQVCAGYVDGKKDSCAGDSGGPLACRLGPNDPWVLYGVVSWGWGCARAAKPGVYARTSHFHEWITSQISGETTAESKHFPCATCKVHEGDSCGPSISPEPIESTQAPVVVTTTTEATTTAKPTVTTTEKPVLTTPAPTTTAVSITTSSWDPCVETYDSATGIYRMTSQGYPQWYQANTKCEKKIFDASEGDNHDKTAVITVTKNYLDNKRLCVRSGDKLVIQCDNVYHNFCHLMQSKTSFGQLACKTVAKIVFASNNIRQNRGFELFYTIESGISARNHCNLPQQLVYNPYEPADKYNYGIVNAYRGLLYDARGNTCAWDVVVPEGNQAVIFFSKTKNFVTGSERYDKIKKTYKLNCRDYVTVSEPDRTAEADKLCGRRAWAKIPPFVSTSNLARVEIHLGTSIHRRERFFFWVGMKKPDGKIVSM